MPAPRPSGLMHMNKRSVLILVLTAACDKSGGGAAERGERAAAESEARVLAAKAADTAATPPVSAPPEKTGVLDLELQRVTDSAGVSLYRILSPRISLEFASLPALAAKDIPAPDGTLVPTGMAMIEGSASADGLMYMPVPKDRAYDLATGIAGTRDGFMKPFDPGYKMTHEPAKLGPFDAMHMIADGTRRGTKTHMEAWIAWDPTAHIMYTVMAIRMSDDHAGIGSSRYQDRRWRGRVYTARGDAEHEAVRLLHDRQPSEPRISFRRHRGRGGFADDGGFARHRGRDVSERERLLGRLRQTEVPGRAQIELEMIANHRS